MLKKIANMVFEFNQGKIIRNAVSEIIPCDPQNLLLDRSIKRAEKLKERFFSMREKLL